MKLFLIPITRRRTLVYAQQIAKSTGQQSKIDLISNKAALTWSQWEHGNKKWQRTLVEAGNKLLRKIPYEEWGLKSVPALSTRLGNEELQDKKIGVVFPPSVISAENIPSILEKLAKEKAGTHKSRFWWSVIGMPIVAPFALVPVIPNIPFFYLAFRAYSHWKALHGGKHLEFLLNNNLLAPVPCPKLDAIYTSRRISEAPTAEDTIIIDVNDAQAIASAVNVPEIANEIERAHYQVHELLQTPKAAETGAKDSESAKIKEEVPLEGKKEGSL
ncbi:mitochondrial K+-H+ exchange-related-domain-containing protein [Peziza echinospora]|nr:mitochondrial K+-H+ exchange-related-domain-containing protein [Peziza echinospora]